MKSITKAFINKLKLEPIIVLDTCTIDDIVFLIQKANYCYYNTKSPLFSDVLYDLIVDYLKQREPNHPILYNVGASITTNNKVKLPYFLGSLDKIKNDDSYLDKWIKNHTGNYVISDKLDGVSALLCFESSDTQKDGLTMFSRGDGISGQDISHLIPFIQNIPSINKLRGYNNKISIRGELIIPKYDFEKMENKGINARNTVSGIVNAITPDLSVTKYIQFIAYEIIEPIMIPSEQLLILNQIGFKTPYNIVIEKLSYNILSDILVKRRKISIFDIDGIVIVHNDIYKYENHKNPSYAFAFKSILTLETAEVIVQNVEWNISKDGYLKPVVIFDDVFLSGVHIKRATGNNAKFIYDNKIGPGSRIIIMRSGDVIPFIKDIISVSETGAAMMPKLPYHWSKTNVDIIVDNINIDTYENKEIKIKNIIYFFDKIGIKGVKEGIIRKLFTNGYDTIGKILSLSVEQLQLLDGFQGKISNNIVSSINNINNNIDCVTLMDASNTFGRGIGKKIIQLIIDNNPSIVNNNYIPKLDELLKIRGINKITAEKFIEGLPIFFKFINENKLQYRKLSLSNEVNKTIDHALNGLKIVFTGFRDEKLEYEIQTKGGIICNIISKNVDLLVQKDISKFSTKVIKAKSMNIDIIELQDFIHKYNLNYNKQ